MDTFFLRLGHKYILGNKTNELLCKFKIFFFFFAIIIQAEYNIYYETMKIITFYNKNLTKDKLVLSKYF